MGKSVRRSIAVNEFDESLTLGNRSLQILRLFDKNVPVSQSYVAQSLQLNPASVHAHFQNLKQNGLIKESGKRSGAGKGRPLEYWDISKNNNFTIGLCFVPPNLLMGLGDFDGNVLLEKQVSLAGTNTQDDLVKIIDSFIGTAQKYMANKSGQLRSMYIGMPWWDTLDHETGVMSFCANMPVLIGWNAESYLSEKYQVVCHSDTHYYAFYAGEAVDLNANTTVCIIDWDLGLGLVTGRNETIFTIPNCPSKTLKGIQNFGHMTLVKSGRPCRCGLSGCLETYVGGWAVLEELNRQDITDLASIIEFAQRGDKKVLAVLAKALKILGEQVSWVVQFFGVDKIIFTGPLSPAFSLVQYAFNEGLGKYLTDNTIKMLDPSTSPHSVSRIIAGACLVGRNIFFDSEAFRNRRGTVSI